MFYSCRPRWRRRLHLVAASNPAAAFQPSGDADELRIFHDAKRAVLLDYSDRLCAKQITESSEGLLALLFCDFVRDIAEASVFDGECGQFPCVLRFVGRPSDSANAFVDAGLIARLETFLRGARLRQTLEHCCSNLSGSETGETLVVPGCGLAPCADGHVCPAPQTSRRSGIWRVTSPAGRRSLQSSRKR